MRKRISTFALAGGTAVLAALLAAPTVFVVGFSTLGGSLGIATGGAGYQRDVRVYNNFQDGTANNNLVPEANFPGALGAPLAIWKGAAVWSSHFAGKNFDFDWQGTTTGIGGVNDNINSSLRASCGGGTLAFTESPDGAGWRIRYCEEWTWSDGPGAESGIDLQGVAAHELGHALGLGHAQSQFCSGSCSLQATMCPVICGSGTAQRSLATDDLNGLQAIYGVIPADKPRITGIGGSTTQGETLTIFGVNFASTVAVKFTAGTSQNTGSIPGVVYNVPSTAGGTRIDVTIPATARPGNVLVWHPGSRLSNPWPLSVGSVPPTITGIAPSGGPVRGGTTVEVFGTNLDERATVTFGGAAATVVDATPDKITVLSPEGSAEGEVVDVTVVQFGGSDTLAAAFTYTQNDIEIVWTGSARIGEPVTFTMFGPANSRAALAVGVPGSLEKAGFTFCFAKPISFKKGLMELNTGPAGQASAEWIVTGSVFDTKHIQGVVKVGSGPGAVLVQTNCETLTVFP